MAWLPAFSSSPPGISTTLSAFSRSMISTSAAEACAASTQRTNRSTRPGMPAMSGTQRHPSMSAVPPFTMRIRSRGNPSRNRLLTMMCPGFRRSETPMMATDCGSSSRASLAMGRSWDASAPAPIAAQLQQDVEGHHAAVVGDDERVDLELADAPADRAPEIQERGREIGDLAEGQQRRLPAHRSRGQLHDRDPLEGLFDERGVGQRRREQRHVMAGTERLRQELRVDAPRADGHDRPDVVGPSEADEQLPPERRRVGDELVDRVPDDAPRAQRLRPCAKSPPSRPRRSCPRWRRPPHRSCGGCAAR